MTHPAIFDNLKFVNLRSWPKKTRVNYRTVQMANTQNTPSEINSNDLVSEIVGALLDLIEEVDPFLRKHSQRAS